MKTLNVWDPDLGTIALTAALLASINGGVGNPALAAVTGTALQTMPAAAIAAGGVARSGQSAARTDLTDTAAAIILATPALNGNVGGSFLFFYQNNGTFSITLGGGTGVTITEDTVVPPNSWAIFLLTNSGSNAVAMVGIAAGSFATLGSFIMNGVTPVTVADVTVTASSIITPTLKTVGGTVGALPAIQTITPGTGFTVAGTALDTSTYAYERKY